MLLTTIEILKGSKLQWSVVLAILYSGVTYGYVTRHHHHQRASSVCEDPWFKGSLKFTLDSVENVLDNIKCRIYPTTCSDAMLRITGTENSRPPSIPVVCSREFLNTTLKFLAQSYKKVTEISHMINLLQDHLFLFSNDPLEKLTNLLLNHIRATVGLIKRDYDVMQVTSSPINHDNTVVNGESGLLIAYTRVATRIESYLQAAICIVDN